MPIFNHRGEDCDFYFIQKEEPEAVLGLILEMVRERIPRRFGFDPATEIQVITPMHRGIVGAGNLNEQLQAHLNPDGEELMRGQRRYRLDVGVTPGRSKFRGTI